MKQILFICTGNSCRSAIAEALTNHLGTNHLGTNHLGTNHLGAGRLQARSAGSQPVGFIHPEAIATLERHAIPTSGLSSKSWDIFAGAYFDLVITVCDSAARETCPVFTGDFKRLHWSVADPAAVTGTETEIEAAFDKTFDLIKHRIEQEILFVSA